MKDSLTLADFEPLARKLAADLAAENDLITSLDAAIGDGDLGVTCRLGLQAVLDSPAKEAASVGEALLKAGMAFNSAGASTFGALVATAAMRMAKYAKDSNVREWDLPSVIAAGEAAITGLQQRGGAQRGDKTLLDALIPAVEALQAAHAIGQRLGRALNEAAQAAQSGAEATAPLKSKFGRAGWLQDRTIGTPDPGATVVALVVRSVAEYVNESRPM